MFQAGASVWAKAADVKEVILVPGTGGERGAVGKTGLTKGAGLGPDTPIRQAREIRFSL